MNIPSNNGTWLAGAAETIITPPIGIPLLGVSGGVSTGVHDDLYARALVLGDGRRSVAIVSLDLIGLHFEWSDEVRRLIAERCGVEATLLCCSHTHSVPFTIPWSVQGWEDLERNWRPWREELKTRIVDVARRAAGDLHPVCLHAGRTVVQIGANRRS